MRTQAPIILFAAALALCFSGCSSAGEGDTSPPPPKDTQTSLDETIKKVESSNMTPDQKAAAIEYAKQNAANATKMKESIQRSQAGPNK